MSVKNKNSKNRKIHWKSVTGIGRGLCGAHVRVDNHIKFANPGRDRVTCVDCKIILRKGGE